MADVMTLTDRLQRVKALDAKATKGPWTVDHIKEFACEQCHGFPEDENPDVKDGYHAIVQISAPYEGQPPNVRLSVVRQVNSQSHVGVTENADFIASARTELPALAAALEQVIALVPEMREKAETFQREADHQKDHERRLYCEGEAHAMRYAIERLEKILASEACE